MKRLIEMLFGCQHRHFTWPQRDKAYRITVTCTDCGNTFLYDWENMRQGPQIPPTPLYQGMR